jgi:hypothetical protein
MYFNGVAVVTGAAGTGKSLVSEEVRTRTDRPPYQVLVLPRPAHLQKLDAKELPSLIAMLTCWRRRKSRSPQNGPR